ncbi:MAG TPA: Wzz/FepE/Etk N-terminal domain-containing protein [Mucilaginibacter sp.]|jgi:hypothetical protein|nr:Wzz/FepE/Etk N-terminal domain-containing protein [Mucilaginibacter sp.]
MIQSDNESAKKPDEISLGDVFLKLKAGVLGLKRNWLAILIIAFLGALIGFVYAIIVKPTYTATCTFVLEEEGKAGALGQYAGLASLAGINLDNAGGGLFEGDNILELYRSRLMIEKTLLSTANFNGKEQLLIERFIDFNELRGKWKQTDNIENISFTGDAAKFSRKQDSIITDLTQLFNKKYLTVIKPDKKLSIIQVDVKSKDELFAKAFADKIVDNVNTFYVQTKTKKSYQNVKILQHQADSVRAELNGSIGGVASAMDAAPNANPLLLSLRVPSQRRQVDVQASSAVYAEIVKNLEVSKISLSKDTPLIQLIDTPVLPLENDKTSKAKGALIGFVLGAVFASFSVIIKKIFGKL